MKVAVVACSKTKAAEPCAAVDLYRGRTFHAAVAHLRALGCERVVILSALHHALRDDAVVAPYQRALADLTAPERRHWTVVARAALSNVLCEVSGRRSLAEVDVHAIVPAAYAGALEGLPRVTRHFAGLPQGQLFAAINGALAGRRNANDSRGP